MTEESKQVQMHLHSKSCSFNAQATTWTMHSMMSCKQRHSPSPPEETLASAAECAPRLHGDPQPKVHDQILCTTRPRLAQSLAATWQSALERHSRSSYGQDNPSKPVWPCLLCAHKRAHQKGRPAWATPQNSDTTSTKWRRRSSHGNLRAIANDCRTTPVNITMERLSRLLYSYMWDIDFNSCRDTAPVLSKPPPAITNKRQRQWRLPRQSSNYINHQGRYAPY